MNEHHQYPLHFENSVHLAVPPERAFSYLDDPKRLASHMSKSSAQKSIMMAGSGLEIELDSAQGQATGAKIVMRGKILGIPIFLDEAITERNVPIRKVWETKGPQKLIVIDQYKMGFTLTPNNDGSILRVFIDYSLPPAGIGFLIGRLLGRVYARWCTNQMLRDAKRHFKEKP